MTDLARSDRAAVLRALARRSRISLSVLGVAIAVALHAAQSASAACTPGWRLTKTLSSGTALTGVSTLPGSAWAVGERYYPNTDWGGTLSDPVIMRFDGSHWTETPTSIRDAIAAAHPGFIFFSVHLNAVFARTATDAWAVGNIHEDDGEHGLEYPLAVHWDGSAWHVVPTPSVPQFSGDTAGLDDVVALSATDAWAVGGYANNSDELGAPTAQPIAMHWDGSKWTLASGTGLGTSWGHLRSVARAPGSPTLWSVGERITNPDTAGATTGPLVERYKSGWAPQSAPGSAALYGVTAIAWNDIWAVGGRTADGSALALHRDDSRWSVVPTAAGDTFGLLAVSAVSSTDVWAVGRSALIEHWDGTQWSRVASPVAGELRDVSMRSSGNGWAVGDAGSTGVIIRHCP